MQNGKNPAEIPAAVAECKGIEAMGSIAEETSKQAWALFEEAQGELKVAQKAVADASEALTQATATERRVFEVARMALQMAREAYFMHKAVGDE